MQIVGEYVNHKVWGTGIIVSADESNVSVFFNSLQKSIKFIFPDVFKTHLTFDKNELQEKVLALYNENNQKKKNEQKQKEKENVLPLPNIYPGKKKKSKSKIPPRRNLFFKMNYCDGGSNNNCIGFKSVCSDSMIRYNIIKAKHKWCSYEDCPCLKYFNKKISRNELEECFNNDFVCYESELLISWNAHAGNDLNGNGNIKQRIIKGAQNGSLAVLTTRLRDMPEQDRIIFGAFIIDSAFTGNEFSDGTVECNSKYHIELTKAEAQKFKFWKYYSNPNKPESITWGTGLFRYFDDDVALKLLQDIVDVKRDTDDYDLAVEILENYKELHQLSV